MEIECAEQLLLLAVFSILGCYQGPPYAFRLMVPPTTTRLGLWLTPYWFWREDGVFETFKACERERRQYSLPEGWTSLPSAERHFWERRILAECVPVR